MSCLNGCPAARQIRMLQTALPVAPLPTERRAIGANRLRIPVLVREVVLTKAGLTFLIDRLEKRALVQRTPDPADRRALRITLTTEGERVFRAAARIHVAGIREHFGSHLSDEEARIVVELFERVKSANLERR